MIDHLVLIKDHKKTKQQKLISILMLNLMDKGSDLYWHDAMHSLYGSQIGSQMHSLLYFSCKKQAYMAVKLGHKWQENKEIHKYSNRLFITV